tara:strand:+ start:331 stop:501 length:171 start_codon:yes stop_codon:yes gene_type:complete
MHGISITEHERFNKLPLLVLITIPYGKPSSAGSASIGDTQSNHSIKILEKLNAVET